MPKKKSTARPSSPDRHARAKSPVRTQTASGGSVAADKIDRSFVLVGDHGRIEVNARARPPAGLRKAYLEYVLQTARRLSLEGVDPKAVNASASDTSLSLDAIYTGLRTSAPEADDLRRGKADLPAHPPKAALSALAALDAEEHLVLLGDPGSGKSTFVSFVALCLAAEGLGRKELGIRALTRPLPVKEASDDGKKAKPQHWRHGAVLPVRVVLRDFAARGLPPAGEKAKATHLTGFIRQELPACCGDAYAPALEQELREKGGLVLLDGLDEVPEAAQRRDQIRDAVVDFAAAFSKCRLLVTSRTYAYRKQGWSLPGFTERELAPFSSGQISDFITRWYRQVAQVRGLTLEDAEGRSLLLVSAIRATDRLAELARRPLLLTLMASLHAWRGGTLPQGREELYSDAVDLLLDRWEANRLRRDKDGRITSNEPSLTEWLRVDRVKVRKLLDQLAFDAHGRQPELRGTADIPADALFGGLQRMTKDQTLQAGQVVEYLNGRAGILLPRGEGVFTFPHRTFQEYLAACHLTGSGYPTTLAKLVREDPERWREVALLAGAKAGRGAPFALWALVERLIPSDPTESEDTVAMLTALVAGQALAESVDINHVEETDLPKLQRVRTWLRRIVEGDVLTAGLRAQAGDTLAAIGDPRFRTASEWCLLADEMFGFLEIPAGPFLMGSDKARDSQANHSEVPQHQVELRAFLMARFPVTVAQFRAFVDATGMKLAEDRGLKLPATQPMTYVSLPEALAYCAWLDGELRSRRSMPALLRQALERGKVTLPSEAEWEKAARGTDGRPYPWGHAWDPERANAAETGVGATSAVGCFPLGKSPFLCEDVSGNVFEWTRSRWGSYPYPDSATDRAGREAPGGDDLRVVRGGCFLYDQGYARAACRLISRPPVRNFDLSFRVVVSPSVSDP